MSGLRHHYLIALALILGSQSLACNRGGDSPLVPAALPAAFPTGDFESLPTDQGLALGLVHLRIDPATEAVEVSPLRFNTAIGDAYLVGLNALRRNFRVESIRRDPGGLLLEVAFDHPFPAATRPDLMGWDLKAIVAAEYFPQPFPDPDVTLANRLVNADGFTSEWTPEIQAALPHLTSTLFPYIVLGADPAAPADFDFANPAGFNCFPAGSTATGEFQLFVDPEEKPFDLSVFFTVGYQVAATKATRLTPDYQPPRGNARAPWRVKTRYLGGDLNYYQGSSGSVECTIWDWQHGQGLGSDVAEVRIHVPELMAAPVSATLQGGSGRDTDPLIATGLITNEFGTAQLATIALIEVRDQLHGANPGGAVGQPGVDVIGDDFVTIRPITDLRTYHTLHLNLGIPSPSTPPTACATSEPPAAGGLLIIEPGTQVTWDAGCSTDPDPGTLEGAIVGWEWDTDWDGDPLNFVDENGGTGTVIHEHLYDTPGEFWLGLRVRDGMGLLSEIFGVQVEVSSERFTLTLGPVQDVPLAPWLKRDQREMAAAFAQLADGRMELNYTVEEFEAPGHVAYQMTSYWQPDTLDWKVSSSDLSSAGILGTTEYGFYLKTCANWGPDGEGIVLWGYSNPKDHSPREVLYAHNCFRGTLALVTDIDAEAAVDLGHGYEIAASPLTGDVFIFLTPFTTSSALQVQNGGPGLVGTPQRDWRTTVPVVTIDPSPSRVSNVRSSFAGAAGDLHIAYTDLDQTELRYARNASGDGQIWTTLALDGGQLGEPAFALDSDQGAYIAVADFSDGTGFMYLYTSADRGATWSSAIPIGGTTGGPWDLALSAQQILGETVICVVYNTAATPDAAGETRLSWSITGGAQWTDLALSEGATTHWPDAMLSRDTPELFVAWSADDPGMYPKMQARQGVWSVE